MFHKVKQGLKAYAKEYNVSEGQALAVLIGVLTYPYEGEITCVLCDEEHEQWWRDNYGPVWEAAQWWYCGPFGLNCSKQN